MEKGPVGNRLSLVAVQDDSLTGDRPVGPSPDPTRRSGIHAGRAGSYLSCRPGQGLQFQVRFFPAYALGSLAGRMFWLMWKMLSGS